MRASTPRKLCRVFTLAAFAAAAAGALLSLRLGRSDLGAALLRGAAGLLVCAILVSLGLPRTWRQRRPFDPRAGREGSG